VKKILISTGGSGGHVIPAIALFDHYRENFEIYLVSDRRGAKYIDQNKYPFKNNIYSSYDKYLSNKYKFQINNQTLERIKNYFK